MHVHRCDTLTQSDRHILTRAARQRCIISLIYCRFMGRHPMPGPYDANELIRPASWSNLLCAAAAATPKSLCSCINFACAWNGAVTTKVWGGARGSGSSQRGCARVALPAHRQPRGSARGSSPLPSRRQSFRRPPSAPAVHIRRQQHTRDVITTTCCAGRAGRRHLLPIEDDVQLTDIFEVAVERFDENLDEIEDAQLAL